MVKVEDLTFGNNFLPNLIADWGRCWCKLTIEQNLG